MNRKRPLILLLGLSVAVGGGLLYLDSVKMGNQTGQQHAPAEVVGAFGPGSQGTTPVNPDGTWPENWVSIGGGPDDSSEIVVLEKSPSDQNLTFKLPGFYLDKVQIAGRNCSRINTPGLVKIQEAGLPELPVVAVSIIVPEGGKTTIKIVEHDTREIKMDPVEPSIGHLTRNIDPGSVIAEFSEFYKGDGIWPEEPVEVSPPFTAREYQGVNVRFNPLRYDAGKGALVVSERLVVDILTDGGFEKRLTFSNADDLSGAGYDRVYGRMFRNYTGPLAADKYQHLPTAGRMLIVSHAAFVPYLQDFMNWKRQRGIDVSVATVAELGGTSGAIAQAISAMYEEPGGLAWVILVGDKAEVPPMVGLYDGSDSDSRYTMVAGNDLYPDLFISRISASTATQVQTQVNRFVTYEKHPDTGEAAAWYGHALGIASNEGTPTDSRRADLLKTELLGYGYILVESVYQGLGGSTTKIRSALEKGCSVVNYLGHGSGYAWTSVPFSMIDVGNLNNEGKWPWIIDVSCSNGEFELDTCFAESWLRAGTPDHPTGAVAMIASTSLAPWVPPTVMQAEAINLLTGDVANTIGSLFTSGLMRVLDQYSGLEVATQVMEQNVVFGDCSLMVRTRAPEVFTVPQISGITAESASWTIDLDGPEGSVVTLTTDGVLHGVGVVNANGRATVNLAVPVSDQSALTLTITGYNMVPYTATLVVGDGEVITPGPEPDSEPVAPARVALLGNFPNPFNPSTRIVFEVPGEMRVQLSVYDIRGSLVRVLADEVMPSGRQEIPWDGRDTAGRGVASGVYLYRLVTPEANLTGRMLLTK